MCACLIGRPSGGLSFFVAAHPNTYRNFATLTPIHRIHFVVFPAVVAPRKTKRKRERERQRDRDRERTHTQRTQTATDARREHTRKQAHKDHTPTHARRKHMQQQAHIDHTHTHAHAHARARTSARKVDAYGDARVLRRRCLAEANVCGHILWRSSRHVNGGWG